MVSLIKNQLLKHLSRYTKNLSSDKINLSTFRGEGELSNLQLDENVLTDLLELPSWLRLTSAWCNHVSFRISWTKLKSVPITLTLDEVNISVETCDPNTRSQDPNSPGLQPIQVPPGKYSFIHKVVDGITIIVNTVNVKFLSPAFTSTVQMSRIRVESKTPKWATADLRMTRLKDPQRGIILIFKELSWQTVRIEASSTQDKTLTPLRLLTNQARCRITIRKRMSDCSVLASRLVLILDDLLWVLTDSQLKAALHFVDSLSGLIKAATHATQKTKAQKKLETLPEYQAQLAQQTRQQSELAHTSSTQKMFNAFDVRETSYHFFSQRIDLHLCDDEGDGRSSYPDLHKGGALQISVQAFQVDYYPYHLAKSDRSHWAKYKEASVLPALWLKESLNSFREAILSLSQPNRPSTHAPLERSAPTSPVMLNPATLSSMTPSSSSGQSTPINNASSSAPTPLSQSIQQKSTLDNLAKLMSACVILRIEDFTLYRVTTSGKKQMPKEFVSAQQKRKTKPGDKDRYSFPPEMPIVHAEFTYFYYPGDFIFPLPPSKVFVHINPLQVHFDLSSVLWFNSFSLNLHESLLRTSVGSPTASASSAASLSAQSEPSLMYMDVKVEAIMPRIVIESSIDAPNQKDRPKIMQIQISRFALTNIREMGSSRADLANALHSLQEGTLVFGSGFPSVNGDMCIVTDRILSHVAASDVPNIQPQPPLSASVSSQNLSRYATWSEPRDVWCIKFDPVWIDFLGARSLGPNKSIPFVDAVPVTLWLHGGSDAGATAATTAASTAKGSVETNIHRMDYTNRNFSTLNPFLEPEQQQQQQETSPTDGASQKLSKSAETSNEKTADMHAIVHISNLVSVQIDHYQYLFLLRLAEEMNELTTFLSLDAERILQKQHIKKSLILGCVVPQVEVTLVMPSPTPGKESSGGDAESVLPDSASLGDDLHMNSTNVWQTHPPLDQVKHSTFGSVETPSPVTNDPPFETGMHVSNPNTHGYNVQIQSTPTVAPSSLQSQGSRADSGVFPPSSAASSSKVSKTRNSITDSSITKEINSSLLSMKKGFSSFMTSIDSAIKSGNPNDDASDTFSIQSDISSDSENFAIVIGDDKTTDCIDVMFRLNPFTTDTNLKASPVEVASEVYEEPTNNYKTNLSSPSEPSEASTWRRRDLVSMTTFRLTTVEVIKQNEGYSSSLRLQVAAISCNECGSIPWDELQTKFGARCKAWNLAPYNPEAPPCVQLRLEETLNPPDESVDITDKKSIQEWFTHHADIRLRDISLDLSMSTVIGLGDLSEDEIITKPLPLNISLENVKLNLVEDRPPVNITSPGPVPINLVIGSMKIHRDENGVLQIQPIEKHMQEEPPRTSVLPRDKDRDREILSLQLVMQQLKLDNENVRKQLSHSKENSESYRQKAKQENDVLRTYLKAAQDDITMLLDEKKALLDTIRSLQLQLTSSNTNRKSDGNNR
ncbi:bridge-like lipid transfer protein family member 3B isoform X3 [Episyrphus balteatus]|uniref:bridge-like lipid transfer protein family member 3B isoform X3 n=1 Tax=Episyrphus balteatus TaxID=286459 RepID=UPI002486707E|nr:bridge-like lipid transfer protein family member 3B isoform X3 [Episyrphus balteatus]